MKSAMDLPVGCNSFARLCELRIILEELRNQQSSSLPPSGGREAISIECGLRYTVSQTVKAFQKTLDQLLTIAENENPANEKLIYREAIEVIEAVDGDRGEFLMIRCNVLSRLISLYEEEENWGAAEWQLQKLNSIRRHGRTDAVADASSKLAECSQKLTAKLGQVLSDINIAIENPLQVDPDTPFPPLLRALWAGYDEVTRILCKKPAALEGRDMLRQNALMVAAAIGKVHLLDPAFRRNPSLLTDRDVLHRHALFHAAHNGDYEAFMTLVRAGANFTDRDASGRSILRVAAASGAARIVEYLLMQDVSPNDDILRDSSALHDAASRGSWTVCRLLLSKGAFANDRLPVDGVPGCYKTPSEVAKHNNFPDIASMIEEAASHPMNDSAHPMNDIGHQEYGQAHEPHHVDETQLTHTASATHNHDENANAPIDNDWLYEFIPGDFLNHPHAIPSPLNASVNALVQDVEGQE
jgi:Ankyrin repeats (3 copies)